MSEFELQVAKLLLAETAEERAEAQKALRSLMENGTKPPQKRDLESEARRVLLDLGVPDHLKGHGQLVTALVLVCKNPDLVNAITSELYPTVAKIHDDVASRVERAIRHAIEVALDRADWEVLHKYFGNTISPNKGKPTNGEFIARVANAIRMNV